MTYRTRVRAISVCVLIVLALGVAGLASATNQSITAPVSVNCAEGDIGTTVCAIPVSHTYDGGGTTLGNLTLLGATSAVGASPATADVDYVGLSEGLTVCENDTSVGSPYTCTFFVTVYGDTGIEPNETFQVAFTSPGFNDVFTNAVTTVTIIDDDAPVGPSTFHVPTVYVDETAGTATVTVELSTALAGGASVEVFTAAGTASVPDNDFTAVPVTTLNFAAAGSPGDTAQSFNVSITDDAKFEPNEYFYVILQNNSAGTELGTPDYGIVVINSDDARPTVNLTPLATVSEGAGSAVYSAALTNPTFESVSVSFAAAPIGGTPATAGSDFAAETGTVVIPAGGVGATISIPIVEDTSDEPAETFSVTLSNAQPGGYSIGTASQTTAITDNDGAPTVSVSNVSVNEGAGTASFTVALSNPTASTVNFNWATANGSATQPADYTSAGAAASIPAGSTSVVLGPIPIVDDATDEPDETFTINLTGITNASNASASGTVTIIDNDGAPTVRLLSPANVNEPVAGTTNQTFTVQLSNPTTTPVTVRYYNNSATAFWDVDFDGINVGSPQSMTIPAGSTSGTFSMTIFADTIDEPNEFYFARLLDVPTGNAVIVEDEAEAYILDSDAAPVLTINSPTLVEGDSGTTSMVFTVTLTGSTSWLPVSFNYATTPGTASPADFVSTGGAITIAAGATSATISVPVVGDTIDEGDETFTVALSNPVNATGTPTGTGTIQDDDAAPTISFSYAPGTTVTEGGLLQVNATLSNPSANPITVDIATSPGAPAATSGADYTLNAASITFPAGAVGASFTVSIADDALYEAGGNEVFNLDYTLGSGTASGLPASQAIEIAENESAPIISVLDATPVSEGNAGTQNQSFTVRLSHASTQAVTFGWRTAGGTAAAADGDFIAQGGAVLVPGSIAAGDTTFTLQVVVNGDTKFEPDEFYSVLIANVVGATLGDSLAFGYLLNDDQRPTVSINSVSVTEGNTGTRTAVQTIALSNRSYDSITVTYSTADGSATAAGGDYGPVVSGTIVIPPNVDSISLTTLVNGDTIDEANETYTVNISGTHGTGGSAGTDSGTVTILDDDAAPTASLSVQPSTTVEENAGFVTVTATLSNASAQAVDATVSTTDGTAVGGTDFVNPGTTITIPAGSLSGSATITIVEDSIDETNETFDVSLTGITNASNATAGPVTVTIVDNDGPPAIRVADVVVNEGVSAVFTFELVDEANALTTSQNAVSFDYALVPGTASAADYGAGAPASPVTIPAGSSSVQVTVPTVNDTTDEPNQTFSIVLSNLVNANALTSDTEAFATIVDNDNPPTVTLGADITQAEGLLGFTAFNFTATLSAASEFDASFRVNTSDWSLPPATLAAAHVVDDDYVPVLNQTFTIPAGSTSVTIPVQALSDLRYELDESFTLSLVVGSGVNATVPTGILGYNARTAVGIITNDDTEPELSVLDLQIVEEDTGDLTTGYITVSKNVPSGAVVLFQLQLAEGTATEPEDYINIGTFNGTIFEGEDLAYVPFTVVGDNLAEGNETFTATITSIISGAVIGDATGEITIIDDDGQPVLFVSDLSYTEGDGDGAGVLDATCIGTANVTVNITTAASTAITFDWALADGTAHDTHDYAAATGSGSIAAGATSTTVPVTICDDDLYDATEETFLFVVSNVVGTSGVGSDLVGEITIVDTPDPAPSLTVTGATVAEGGVVTFSADFGPSGQAGPAFAGTDITVTVNTVNGSNANAFLNAVGGADFAPSGLTVLVFPELTGQQTLGVQTLDDAVFEATEAFGLTVVNAGPTLWDAVDGVGTITENDAAPTVSVLDLAVNEGNQAGIKLYTHDLQVSRLSAMPITVQYAVEAGGNAPQATLGTCAPGVDLDESDGAPLTATVAAYALSASLSVEGCQDLNYETDEYYQVTLSGAFIDVDSSGTNNAGDVTLAVARPVGFGTILNDDALPVIEFAAASLAPSVAETAGSVTLTVQLGGAAVPANVPITFSYVTGDLSANDGSDYTGTQAGVGTILAGATSTTIGVPILDDAVYELTEYFSVALTGASNAAINAAADVSTVEITDDDTAVTPTLTIDSVTVTEGNTAVFTVSLAPATGFDVFVDFATSNGTADSSDYVGQSGTLTFLEGQTSQTISIVTQEDTLFEPSETFNVTLSNAQPGGSVSIGTAVGVGTITDDDVAPQLSVSDIAQAEGSAGGGTNFVFSVTLDAPAGSAATFDWTLVSTTTDAADFVGVTSGSGSIAAGAASTNVVVTVAADTIYELDEYFYIELSNPVNAAIADAFGNGVIENDDTAPTVTISDVTLAEGTAGTLTVTRTGLTQQSVDITYTSVDVTAEAGSDYTAISGSVTIPGGGASNSATIPVDALTDAVFELAETYHVVLTGAGSATVADDTGVVTITNTNLLPVIDVTVDPVTANEGTVTNTYRTVTFSLSTASVQTVTVDYDLLDGTFGGGWVPAIATDDDYIDDDGTITFLPGETEKTVTVEIIADTKYEQNERFRIGVGNAVNATLFNGNPTAIRQINVPNDDGPPLVSIQADVEVLENVGSVTITLTTDEESYDNIVVQLDTADIDALGSGPLADYVALVAEPITITAGSQSASTTVTIINDALDEDLEQFEVIISGIVSGDALIDPDDRTVVTIRDNDRAPVFTVSDVTDTEENGPFVFTINSSAPSGRVLRFDAALADITAQLGIDYATAPVVIAPAAVDAGGGSIVIPENFDAYPITVTVDIVDDTTLEADEQFTLSLVNLLPLIGFDDLNSDFDGVGTIVNTDTATLAISIDPNTVVEGLPLPFVVTITDPAEIPVEFAYTVSDGTSASPATAPDYVDENAVFVTIPAGAASAAIPVQTVDDVLYELTEDVIVDIASPVPAAFVSITTAQAQGFISDNDAAPSVSISDAQVVEGDSGDTYNMVFTVTLSAAAGTPVSVDYTTADTGAGAGFATANVDYTTTAGNLTYAPGQTIRFITVPVLGDGITEGDEVFAVNLTNPVPATVTIADASGQGVIVDDEVAPILSITDVTADPEGDADGLSAADPDACTGTVTLTVSIANTSVSAITFEWATADGTALDTHDYPAQSGSGVIAAGSLSTTLDVTYCQDTYDDLDTETFTVVLSNLTNAALAGNDTIAAVNIVDDDATPTISIADAPATPEGSPPGVGGSLVYPVTLSAPTGRTVSFTYTVSDGAAPAATVSDTDYLDVNGALVSLPPLSDATTVSVQIVADSRYELDENVSVAINATAGLTNGTTTANGVISNDDAAPVITVAGDSEVYEGDAGTTPLVFTAKLDRISGADAQFTFSTVDGTALVSDSDYVAVAPGAVTVTIPAGLTEQTFSVDVVGDTKFELNETFTVTIDAVAPHVVNGADVVAVGTILTDDIPPVLSVGDATVTEGNSPAITDVTITLSLSEPSEYVTEVFYYTLDGDGPARATLADTDFVYVMQQAVIPANTLSIDLTLPIVVGDEKYEQDETFFVVLTDAYNATLGDAIGLVTITNDDGAPSVFMDTAAVSVVEGDTGLVDMIFTARLSNPTYQTVTVWVDTSDGSAAFADSDYQQAVDLPVVFAEDEVVKTFVVKVIGDEKYELDETLQVTLGLPAPQAWTGSIGAPASHIGTIVNDDPIPTLAMVDASVNEGDPVQVVAVLTNPSYEDISVTLVTTAGTALDPDDYAGTAGTTITIPNGTMISTPFAIATVDDTLFELTETFTGDVSAPAGAVTLGDADATYSIVDDDPLPVVTVNDVSVVEGDAGTTTMTFDIALATPAGIDITFLVNTANSSVDDATLPKAKKAIDYVQIIDAAGVIPAGSTVLNFDVTVIGEEKVEEDEYLSVLLSGFNYVNAGASDLAGVGMIENDDVEVVVPETDFGFEFGVDPWELNSPNGTDQGDKLRCGKGDAYEGDCYFRFKGRANENVGLKMILTSGLIPGPLAINDGLRLSLWYKTTAALPQLAFKAKVFFTDGTEKLTFGGSIPVAPTSDIWTYASAEGVLADSIAIDKIKLKLRHKSITSRIDVDAVRLEIVPGLGLPRDAQTRSGTDDALLPPPPPVVDGWSGHN
ncbi:MAG: hypothetical protein IPM16_21025 [Chloroflexi bacterium]|nr:hypothetical protein [Chloroflexota bacterium]